MHYPIPIHLQAAYAGRGFRRGAFPVTERLADRVISLPMFPELNDDQLVRVTDAIAEFNGRGHEAVAADANGRQAVERRNGLSTTAGRNDNSGASVERVAGSSVS